MKDLHPSIAHFKPLFAYAHLPEHLQRISKPFGELAEFMMQNCEGPEASAGLRKLLEAKDCAVRAALKGSND
jgi:hypothetical protein